MNVAKFKILKRGNYFNVKKKTMIPFYWAFITEPIERAVGTRNFPLQFESEEAACNYIGNLCFIEIYIVPNTNMKSIRLGISETNK